MAFFDGQGNEISFDKTQKGAEISVRAGYTYTDRFGLSADYADAIQEAKDAWIQAQKGDERIIPLIIHTDQHGNLTADNPLFRFIDHIVNWNSISKVCNLGDTCANTFTTHASQDLSVNAELEAAVKCMSYIPSDKQINLWGNHHYWTSNDGWVQDRSVLEQYFRSGNAHKTNREGCYTIIDQTFNVKYLIVSGFQGDSTLVPETTYSMYYMQTYTLDWLINEMGKADGYDIVVLSHNRLSVCMSGVTKYNPITGDSSDAGEGAANIMSVGNLLYALDVLWRARKNKTAGTVTDRQGTAHPYDFTSCNSEFLCALHGHMHTDSFLHDGGLLEAGFDYYLGSSTRPKSIHFVLIDRSANKLRVWKVTTAIGSTSPAVTPWECALTDA